MKFLFSIVIIAIILLAGCTVFIPDTTRLSISAKIHFRNWDGQDRKCSITAVKCDEYFETVHHLPCYLVYGQRYLVDGDWKAHMWNIVMINGVPYEFESTSLEFWEVSEKYTVQCVQEGFYVDGIKYEKSQKLDN